MDFFKLYFQITNKIMDLLAPQIIISIVFIRCYLSIDYHNYSYIDVLRIETCSILVYPDDLCLS